MPSKGSQPTDRWTDVCGITVLWEKQLGKERSKKASCGKGGNGGKVDKSATNK